MIAGDAGGDEPHNSTLAWLTAHLNHWFALRGAKCRIPTLHIDRGRAVWDARGVTLASLLVSLPVLGLVMGLGEAYGYTWGDLRRMLGAHVVFAAIGWVTLTICAASYRFIPAFLLPTVKLPSAARWQIGGLALSVAGLGLTSLFDVVGVAFWAAAVALSLIAYLLVLQRLIRSRRMKINWGIRHAQIGAVWLVVAIVLGTAVAWKGGWSEDGARLAGTLAAAGLLGWMINFIIGMSYQLFPGFVSRVRSALGWPAVTIAELSVPRMHPFIFVLYNCGAGLVVIAFLVVSPPLALWGSLLLAGGTSLYASATVWGLSFAYRKSLPLSANAALRVLG